IEQFSSWFSAVADPGRGVRLDENVADSHGRIERGVRVLEDDLDVTTGSPTFSSAGGVDLGATKGDPSLGDRSESKDGPTDGCLAGAGLTHHAQRFAFVEVKRYACDNGGLGLAGAEPHDQVCHFENRCAHWAISMSSTVRDELRS